MKDDVQALPQLVSDMAFPPMVCKRITLRDYLAGQALAGMVSNAMLLAEVERNKVIKRLADTSYEIADAMIVERDKKDGV